MGLKSWLFGDFVDKIEWSNNSKESMFYKYPLEEKEVSYNAKLVVKEGEVAIIALNSRVFDTFTFGEYFINIETLPNIAKELNWDSSYDDPFDLDIYFINRDKFTFKWGTKEPILLNDRDSSIVKLVANGEFSLHIYELKHFINFVLKKENVNYKDSIVSLFKEYIVEALVNRRSSIFTLASNKDEFSQFLYSQVNGNFNKQGLMLDSIKTKFLDAEQELPSFTGLEESNSNSEDDSKIYYIIINSKANGPYSKNEILKLIDEDKLIAASYIWKDGLESWVKLKDIFDLEALS
jgi:membrane protease subunit (stomatin/prohibitin family)